MNKKTILIVGASSDIGRALIADLAADDTTILAHYFSSGASLEQLQGTLPGRLVPLQADLSSEAGVDGLISAVEQHCAFPQQIVLLAAPRLNMTRFKDLAWADFRRHSDIELCTAVKVCGRFLPLMAKQKDGRVVFVLSSVTLGVPPASMADYVSGKYAMLGLMKALASEYAGRQLRINAVSPSMVATRFLSDLPDKIVEFSADSHPLRRNAVPADVAPAIKFLLSDGAAYMTGVNLPIAGGTHA